MTNELHEYTFEVRLFTSIRVKAQSLQEAKDGLEELLECVTINLGEIDGEAIVVEASVEDEPRLVEFDGEPASDINGKIQWGFLND